MQQDWSLWDSEVKIPLPEVSLELPSQPLHEGSRGVVAAPVGGPPLAEYVRVDLKVDEKLS